MIKKAILFFALFFIATCADGPLFDVSKFFDTDIELNGAPVTTQICCDEKRFKLIKTVLKPEEIVKGGEILIKVQGVALETLYVKKLRLVTKYNGGDIFTDNKAIEKSLPEGQKLVYDYTASIPTFTPSGSWDIYIYLMDDKDVEIHCLKAHFDMP